MNTLKKYWYWILIALVLFFVMKKKTNDQSNEKEFIYTDNIIYLYERNKKEEVKHLQRKLNSKGFNLNVDGIYGEFTSNALWEVFECKRFLNDYGVENLHNGKTVISWISKEALNKCFR